MAIHYNLAKVYANENINQEFTKKILNDFINHIPEDLKKIEFGIESKQYDAVKVLPGEYFAERARTYFEDRAVTWLDDRAIAYIDGDGYTARLDLETAVSTRLTRDANPERPWLPDPTLRWVTSGEP